MILTRSSLRFSICWAVGLLTVPVWKRSVWMLLRSIPKFGNTVSTASIISSGPQAKQWSTSALISWESNNCCSLFASIRPLKISLSLISREKILTSCRRVLKRSLRSMICSENMVCFHDRLPYTKVKLASGWVFNTVLTMDKIGVIPLPAAKLR